MPKWIVVYFFSIAIIFFSCKTIDTQKLYYKYDSIWVFDYRNTGESPGYWEKKEKSVPSMDYFILLSNNEKTKDLNQDIIHGQYIRSCTYYENQIKQKNLIKNPIYWNNFGVCSILKGDYENANQAFNYAGSLDSRNVHILNNKRKLISLEYLHSEK